MEISGNHTQTASMPWGTNVRDVVSKRKGDNSGVVKSKQLEHAKAVDIFYDKAVLEHER